MNHAIFRRLIWKEYRLQRAFWIAMVVLAVMVMLFIWAVAPNLYDRIYPLFCIAFGAPVFYALGCASTTFAGEHDVGTYEFQRSLPVTALRLFWGKISVLFLSMLAMFVPLLFLAFSLSDWKLHIPGADRSWDIEIWGMAGFAGVVAWLYIVWGVFFSLILKRPLLAVVLSVTVASMGLYWLIYILQLFFLIQAIDEYRGVIVLIFVGISILLAVIDVLLGRRWLRESVHPAKRLRELVKFRTATKADTLADYLSRPNSWSILLRLTWQHWRQSAWVGIIILATFAALGVADVVIWWEVRIYGSNVLANGGEDHFIVWLHIFIEYFTLIFIPLLCSFTFLADQGQKKYRFFAERGIGPRLVWLSRLWPWLLIVIIWFALYVIFFTAYLWDWQNPSTPSTQRYLFSIPWYLLGYLALSICVGQFCSMFFRSGIPAGVFSLVITAILSFWAALMWMWAINWLWSVVPIPLVLLLATWLRAPDWVLERKGPRTWLRPGLVVAVPAIILLTAVPFYRVYQIPVVDPGFSVAEFTRPPTPEERATRELFIKASEKIRALPQSENEKYNPAEDNIGEGEKTPVYTDSTIRAPLTAEDIAWVELNREVIPLLIEASKGSERIYSDAHGGNDDHFFRRTELDNLLIHSAMMLESDGRLDEALEQYLAVIRISKQLRSTVEYVRYVDYLERKVYEQLPFWATRSGQTAERIKNAVVQLEKLTADMPVDDVEIKVDYIRFREALSTNGDNYYKQYQPFILWPHFPWERARTLRLINMVTREDLDDIHKAVSNAKNGKRIDVLPYWPAYASDTPGRALTSGESLDLYYFRRMQSSRYVIWHYAVMENCRRAARIVLALQAWKLEHGGYPKTLDELVGPYFKELPKDPYRAEPYQYFPEGLKAWIPGPGMNFELLSSGMDKPFIWSTSPEIEIRPNQTKFLNRYYVNDMGKSSGYNRYEDEFWRDTSLYDNLSHGRCFFLP